MNLGNRLIEIRKKNKMSQEEFSEIFNVTRQTISNWENSKSYPDIETIIKISDYFDISLDILLKGDKKLIKEIDKKVKKNKLLIIIIIILICLMAIYFILEHLFPDKIGDNYEKLPGVVIVCRYKDEILQYHATYNKIFKYPIPGSWNVGRSQELKHLNTKIQELHLKTKKFNNIENYIDYVLKLYEDAGATCKMEYYKNSDDYVEKATKMQADYLDMIEEEKKQKE